MLKPLTLKPATVNDYLRKGDDAALAEYLKDTFTIQRDPDGAPMRFEFAEEAVLSLHQALTATMDKPTKIELFRALRNYVINHEVRDYIVKHGSFLNDIKFGSDADLHKAILQFLINLTVKSGETPEHIMNTENASRKLYSLFGKDIVKALSQNMYESSALLYNISLFQSLCTDTSLYKTVLDLIELHEFKKTSSTVYLFFLLEKFIGYDDFWSVYDALKVDKRMAILETLRDLQVAKKLHLAEAAFPKLIRFFELSSRVVFQTVSTSCEDLETHEPVLLVEIFASLSGDDRYLSCLQTYGCLLVHCGMLLINLHKLGKLSDNCFTPVQNLSELNLPSEEIAKHPAFGLKAALIRIIGNMCWKSPENRDLVGEAELIPYLLDCSTMDARNPLISQWVIFAIRNIVENHPKNQAVIADLHQQGTVDSTTLEEMGLKLHQDGNNTMQLIPLSALRKQQADLCEPILKNKS